MPDTVVAVPPSFASAVIVPAPVVLLNVRMPASENDCPETEDPPSADATRESERRIVLDA